MSVLKLVPYSFDYQSFIVSFEMRSVRLSMIFFFCRVVLAIWHPLKFPVNFRMFFSLFPENVIGILTGLPGICRSLWAALPS